MTDRTRPLTTVYYIALLPNWTRLIWIRGVTALNELYFNQHNQVWFCKASTRSLTRVEEQNNVTLSRTSFIIECVTFNEIKSQSFYFNNVNKQCMTMQCYCCLFYSRERSLRLAYRSTGTESTEGSPLKFDVELSSSISIALFTFFAQNATRGVPSCNNRYAKWTRFVSKR